MAPSSVSMKMPSPLAPSDGLRIQRFLAASPPLCAARLAYASRMASLGLASPLLGWKTKQGGASSHTSSERTHAPLLSASGMPAGHEPPQSSTAVERVLAILPLRVRMSKPRW